MGSRRRRYVHALEDDLHQLRKLAADGVRGHATAGQPGRSDPGMSYRLGIDVGGTFTDFVLVDGAGRVTEAKTPSTRASPAEAIERGLLELSGKIARPL